MTKYTLSWSHITWSCQKKKKKKLFLKKDLRLSIPAVNKKKSYLRIYGVMWFHSKCKIHAFLVAELRWINTSSCHRIRCLLETTWCLMKMLLFCTVGQWHISGDKKEEKSTKTPGGKKNHTPYNWCLGDIRTCRNGLTGTSKRGLVISAGSLPQSYMHKYSAYMTPTHLFCLSGKLADNSMAEFFDVLMSLLIWKSSQGR